MTDEMQALFYRYPKVGSELQRLIEVNDLDCVDNRRMAKADDAWQRIEFDEAAYRGCCGTFERIVNVDGVDFLVGCNYGH